jgi:hypothetical protein
VYLVYMARTELDGNGINNIVSWLWNDDAQHEQILLLYYPALLAASARCYAMSRYNASTINQKRDG